MWKKCLAEAIGTFALVFAGTGAIIANEMSNGAVTHVGIAISFGLAVTVFIYALAGISGAHFNPAVSFSFLQLRRIELVEFCLYLLSQLAGALIASAILYTLVPLNSTLGSTVPHVSARSAFIIETILTFFLLFVILQVTKLGTILPITTGIAVGSTVALDALFAGQFTGASMNQARSIAPALISGTFTSLWIYILAPLAGASIATVTSKYLLSNSKTK